MSSQSDKQDRRNTTMPDGSIYKIRHDKYQKKRGRAEILTIRCQGCEALIFIYQKDGPGPLKRCYLDRIAWTNPNLLHKISRTEQIKALQKSELKCPDCNNLIGIPMIYVKENRRAIRMSPGRFKKTKYPIS